MRYIVAVFLACTVFMGATAAGHAAASVTRSAGGVSIELPKDWNVIDKKTVAQLQAKAPSTPGGQTKILIVAEAPEPDFLKLTVTEVPGAMATLTHKNFGAMSSAEVGKLCTEYKQNVAKASQGLTPSCERVKNGKAAALATGFDMPASGQRPALSNVTWMFPRGTKTTVVTFLCLENEKQKFLPTIEKILQTVKPGPDGK